MTREALRRRATSHLRAAATVVVAFAFVAGLRLPGLGAGITAPAAIAAAPAPTAAAPAATAAAPVPLRMSDSGLARIRGSEAFSAKVYDDGAGNPDAREPLGLAHCLRLPCHGAVGRVARADAGWRG